MEAFKTLTSKTIILPNKDIDTDQIIPARFLTVVSKDGLGENLFYDWRYHKDGSLKEDNIFNQIDPNEHRIIVAGNNFGCGSSREHAPWALYDYGIRVVISTEIADIFKNNALKNGVLPIVVDQKTHAYLMEHSEEALTIDLENNQLTLGDGSCVTFEVEPFARICMLQGVDQLGFLLNQESTIKAYEKAHEVF